MIRSSDWLRLKLLMMGDSEVKERVMLGWTAFARGGGGGGGDVTKISHCLNLNKNHYYEYKFTLIFRLFNDGSSSADCRWRKKIIL
jgi:hypothetical protein